MTTFPSLHRRRTSATAVEWAVSEDAPLEILGHGSKRGIGRPSQCEHALDLSAMSGVTLYEPEELVLSAKAGTPLADIERLLAQNGQQLAFEPMDCSRLLGPRHTGRQGRHDRRGARRQSVRPAPAEGRGRARPHPRRQRGVGARRDVQVGRPRGQERHRLRSVQADDRLVGHARRADRRDLQGAAGGRDGDDAGDPRPQRRGRHRGDGAGDGLERRGVGRGASALWREPSAWRATCAAQTPRRCCASKVLDRRSPIASRR